MDMEIDFNLKFHPVGFGLFSSGKIGNFRFVYDCGSTKKRVVEQCVIDEFTGCSELGLLAISHFHKDHISGIQKLLDTVDYVKTIVLPYFTPSERLIYILSLYTEEIIPEEWLLDFLTDPINYLLSNYDEKIGKIALIKGGGEIFDNDSNDKQTGKSIDDNLESLEIDLDNLNNSQDEPEIKTNEGITSPKVSVKEYGLLKLTSSTKTPIWQFIFYSPILTEEQKDYFKRIIISSLTASADPSTKSALLDIISKGDFAKNAKKSGITNDDINNTSLLLYHSPILNLRSEHVTRYEIEIIHDLKKVLYAYYREGFTDRPSGFFYTGDICLKNKLVEINSYYNSLLDKIFLLQVPHHGSLRNWDNDLSKRNPGLNHVVSSRLSNPRRIHPDSEVLYQIMETKGITLWSNETNPIDLNGFVWHF